MALEHRMIEPFEPNQVRQVDGRRVISYGTSSYGYDIRCADEFKLFTNIYSAIVDPKNFDPQSFVDIKGNHVIIPPNSFALARTVEYFRVPRNVLILCVGKSTYARCFRGDTRVALVDGTAPTLEEMARRATAGEMFWGYSIDQCGRIIVALLDAPRYIGRDALLEIVLDNGEAIHATPDHEFILPDGRLAQAHTLSAGDSLMSLYRQSIRGYEAVYQPLNGHFYPTHRLADEWNIRHGITDDAPGTRRHHRDYNRCNNMPWNIGRMIAADHIRYHNAKSYGEDFDPALPSQAIGKAFEREMTANLVREALHQAGSIRGATRLLDCDRTVSGRFPEVIAHIRASAQKGRNHKIEHIRAMPGEHDVYCLTVPEAGNFALEAGVFVRNCGIIVNVTPLEPEWEGYVTLEFSNTTPMPAKIYANEGVAQVIFFEADEVCQVSYKDRGGKYQGQLGVTPPKL